MASERSEQLRRLVGDLRTAATMPRLTIVLSRGGEEEEAVLERFRMRTFLVTRTLSLWRSPAR